MSIAADVLGHFDQLFAEMESAIAATPDELWRDTSRLTDGPDVDDWPMLRIPCFLAHHMVWCMCLEHLLRIDPEGMPHNIYPDYSADKLFTRRQVLDLLGDIRARAREIYADMPDAAFLEGAGEDDTPLSRLLYALAHTRQHYGQFVQILRDHGVTPPEWYPLE